jgi:hypothetical protein
MMPLSFTPLLLRLKRCHACDEWHSSRVPPTPLTVTTINSVQTPKTTTTLTANPNPNPNPNPNRTPNPTPNPNPNPNPNPDHEFRRNTKAIDACSECVQYLSEPQKVDVLSLVIRLVRCSGFRHGFCRVRVSPIGVWLVQCSGFTMDSAVLGLAPLGCGWCSARL